MKRLPLQPARAAKRPNKATAVEAMQDQYIAIDDVNIRYRDTGGTGIPVLLTHGIGGSLELWNKQLDSLGEAVRLISWDMPGHGLSDLGEQPYDPDSFAAFAWRFVDGLGLNQIIVVGNSMGGAVSLRMAATQTGRVLGVLLADAATLGTETPLPFRLMTLPVLGAVMNKPGPLAVENQLKGIFHNQDVVTEEIREIVTRNVHKPGGDKAFIATLRRMTTLRGQRTKLVKHSLAILGSLKQKVVLVHGRQDAVLPFSHSVRAAETVANAELFLLEGCGHTPQVEAPQQFNQILRDLVATSSGIAPT